MPDYSGFNTTDPVINAETRSPIVYTVCITFGLISLAAVILRLYTRIVLLRCKRLGADDVAIIIAEILALVCSLCACMEARNGLGRHSWTVTPEEEVLQARWLYVVIVIYNLATNLVKMAFLFQYRRLFADAHKWTLRVVNVALCVTPIWAVIQVCLLGTSCLPLATIIPSAAGHCLPTQYIWLASSAMNIITDFSIFLIPLPALCRIKGMRQKQKVLLVMIFCIGFFTCIISVIRIQSLSSRTDTRDYYWTAIAPACWSNVEINCGILCSCLTTLRPLARRVFPRFSSTKSDKGLYDLSGKPRTGRDRRGEHGIGERLPSLCSLEISGNTMTEDKGLDKQQPQADVERGFVETGLKRNSTEVSRDTEKKQVAAQENSTA